MHTIGDAHVYVNHIDALKEQVWDFAFTISVLEIRHILQLVRGAT